MIGVALFLVGSAAILWLSWRSLSSPRAHGFYRFFAFELIWLLIVRNIPVWFHNPFSIRQFASYLLGLVSILLAIEGFRLLRRIGRPAAAAAQRTSLGFENTTSLVTSGVYRYIRHPLYASLFALDWCAWLKAPLAIANFALALAAAGFLLATAVIEEKENLARFGAEYSAYMKRTRRFVPFLF
jgi:protein-S-isoprenylcysteine O-methyltransferase Ste14